MAASRLSFLEAVEIDADPIIAGEHRDVRSSQPEFRELALLSREFALGIRALALSLGTPGPLDTRYVTAIKQLADITKPLWVSGHIAFSRVGSIDLGAFLPLAPNLDSVGILSEHVAALSETLGATVLLENVFSHLQLTGSFSETAFINRVCETANCGFSLDIDALEHLGNRFGFDPSVWIRDIDPGHIKQLRVPMPSPPAHGKNQGVFAQDRLLTEALRHASISRIILDTGANGTDVTSLTSEVLRLRTLIQAALVPEPTPNDAMRGAEPTQETVEIGSPPSSFEYSTTASRLQEEGLATIRPLADVKLFFLDDGGILFSEPHQELHELNSGAAFVWLCLEEGCTQREIVERYAATFATDTQQAENLVFGILEWWQNLGFIAPFQLRRTTSTHFTSAITCLMRNPTLRELFRQSPNDVARLLNISSHLVDTFLSIDPDELEQQAQLTETRRRWIRSPDFGTGGVFEEAPRVPTKTPGGAILPIIERQYRLLDTQFQLQYETELAFQRVHSAISHLAADSPDEADVILRLALEDTSFIVLQQGEPHERCAAIEKLTPLMISRFRRIATSRYDFLARIHAGVVSNGSACAVFPAPAGSGKTTLVAALVANGLRYFSDEYALLKSETLDVAPVPFAMTIKDGSVNVLNGFYPELDELTVHTRIDNVRVRYLLPPADRCAASTDQSMPVRWVVFPRYDATAETRLIPIERLSALRRLLDQCQVLPDDVNWRKVQRLVRWFRNVECFELPFSSLTTAVRLIRGMMDVKDEQVDVCQCPY